MSKTLSFALVLLLSRASFAASAATPYVAVEQRLTAEQRHATGLNTLSPAQLELLNSLIALTVGEGGRDGRGCRCSAWR